MTAGAGSIVLALNSGSSSLKFGLYRVGPASMETLMAGEAEAVGEGAGQVEAMVGVTRRITGVGLPAPEVIGHRLVHGGPMLRRHCLIDPSVLEQLEASAPFAPLHLPAALSIIRFTREHFPGLPQAACFDTAFHADMPEVARVLPIARALRTQGLQRYGFHGLSCESILHQLGDERPDRLIIAHLGAGASVTAVKAGRSIDTSMGLTPTGGIMMAARSGDLDPGVLLYLMREKGFDAAMIEDLVDRGSGLLGVSGLSGDMRALHKAEASNPAARLAIEMFCYAVRKQIAAMIAALDGADLIVFAGGVGENDALVRGGICAGLSWIGVELDPARNQSRSDPISDEASRCAVRVIESREDEQIARHAWALARLG